MPSELSLPAGSTIVRDGYSNYPPLRILRGAASVTREGGQCVALGPGDMIDTRGHNTDGLSVVAATALQVVTIAENGR